jgi:F-type H+-transporting ATPase subunit delta
MSLATAYARALHDAARESGGSSGDLDRIESHFDDLLSALDSSDDLRKLLYGPVVTSREKAAVVEDIANRGGYPSMLRHFLVLLAQKERLPALPEVREALSAVRLEAEGGVSAKLVSAEPMSEADLKTLSEAFTRKLGKKVAFRATTNPALLAGIQVTINGVTYDGSLKSQLYRLRDSALAGYAAR